MHMNTHTHTSTFLFKPKYLLFTATATFPLGVMPANMHAKEKVASNKSTAQCSAHGVVGQASRKLQVISYTNADL